MAKKNESRRQMFQRWKREEAEAKRIKAEAVAKIEADAEAAKKIIEERKERKIEEVVDKPDHAIRDLTVSARVSGEQLLEDARASRKARLRSRKDMRRLLMSCVTEEELIRQKEVLSRIATNPIHKDCIKAISLLWSYALGKPELDIRLDNAAEELTLEEKKQMLAEIIKRDPSLKERLRAVLSEGEHVVEIVDGTSE